MEKLFQLNAVPNTEWENKFNKVIKDEYISKKYNRDNYIKEKLFYIDNYASEIKAGNGFVLDIGPGTGEFLEICKHYKNKIIGIDAIIGECEMGDEYLILSQLMTERQDIPVNYIGFENILLTGRLPFYDNSLTFVNSQGSIEMVFKKHLLGPPHIKHKNCNLLSWNITDNLKNDLELLFSEVRRILVNGGIFLIYGNGAINVKDYNVIIMEIADKTGLRIEFTKYDRLHKMKKIS